MASWFFPARSTESAAAVAATGASGGGWGTDPIDGDSGYAQLGVGRREVPQYTTEKARVLSIAAYRSNPMARAIIDTYVSFAVGDSGVSARSVVPEVHQFVDRWWHDPRVRLGTMQPAMMRDWMLQGEFIPEYMVGENSGVVRWSPIDPAQVLSVDLDRGNALWPKTLNIRNSLTGGMIHKQIAQVDEISRLRTGEVGFFPSWKALLTDRRGTPFLMPLLDDLEAYGIVFGNLIDRTALARYMVWDVTLSGAQADVDEFVRKRGGVHAPPSGSVEVHNDSVAWKPQAVDTKSAEDSITLGAALTNVAAGAGLAKAQPLDCDILTPSGWRPMGDIEVGDTVMTPRGSQARVLGVFPQGETPAYRVTFSDGAVTRASGDHLWYTQTAQDRKHHRPGSVKTTDQISASLRNRGHWNHYVPLIEPIDGADELMPVDPYLLGVLLGDGHIRQRGTTVEVMLSSGDIELVDRVNDLLTDGGKFVHQSQYDYRYTNPSRHAGLRVAMRDLGICGARSHTKRIPQSYLQSGHKARLAMLQGLLDTDGSPSASTSALFSTVSEGLADDVRALVWSLGGVCTKSKSATSYDYRGKQMVGRPAYRLRITLPESVDYFRLARKQSQIGRAQKTGRAVRTIRNIEPIGTTPCQCIMIDDPDHLYVTDDYIVTHNTWLADPEDANRATSLSMAEPVRRRVGGVQQEYLSIPLEMTRYAVDRAVAAGQLPAYVQIKDSGGAMVRVPAAETVFVTGPEIAASDAQVTAAVFLNLSQALDHMVATGALTIDASKLAAQKAWEQFMGQPFRPDLAADANVTGDGGTPEDDTSNGGTEGRLIHLAR